MLKFFYMKKIVLLLVAILTLTTPLCAQVINAELEDIIKVGIEKNQDIKIKRLELEAAQKDIKVANRLKNPQIQSNVVMGNVALGNSSQAGIAIPIEIAKRSERKRAATKAYEVKETELKQFEHSFKLEIMKAYFDILYAKSVYKIQQDRLKLFESLVKITTDKPKYPSYEIDNLKADIQYAQQLIEVNRAKSNMLAKQFELNKILNTDDEEIMYDTKEPSLLGQWAFLDMQLPQYEYLEKIALEYSYVIKISDKNISLSEAELSSMKRNRVPDITIGGGYAWQAHPNVPYQYGGAYAGLNIDIPVFYTFKPEIQKAQIFLERSKVSKKAYIHQLKYQLKKDYNNLKYSKENMIHSKKILENSKKIVELSTQGYIKGKNSYTDLVINENGHQEVISQYLGAMSRYFYSYLELMQDVGHDKLIEDELL